MRPVAEPRWRKPATPRARVRLAPRRRWRQGHALRLRYETTTRKQGQTWRQEFRLTLSVSQLIRPGEILMYDVDRPERRFAHSPSPESPVHCASPCRSMLGTVRWSLHASPPFKFPSPRPGPILTRPRRRPRISGCCAATRAPLIVAPGQASTPTRVLAPFQTQSERGNMRRLELEFSVRAVGGWMFFAFVSWVGCWQWRLRFVVARVQTTKRWRNPIRHPPL